MSGISFLLLGTVVAQGATDDPFSKAGADFGLKQAFARALYSVKDAGHGTLHGQNPAQRLALRFEAGEVRLSHPDGDVTFRLAGYGYGDRLANPQEATVSANHDRVEYRRGDLVEWYVNGAAGLEQGFTLKNRLEPRGASGPLTIALAVRGGPLQSADGVVLVGGVLRYAGLKAVDARGRVLLSRLETRRQEIRLLVDDWEAEYPLTIDPTWMQQAELAGSDSRGLDSFGFSVSVSGDTAVVGAPGHNVGSNLDQGAAYVFTRSAGVWSQQAELTASDGGTNDNFGYSVSVSGDTAVIGAYQHTVGSIAFAGAAYVFTRSAGVWSQQAELTASDGAVDHFGYSVSVSGDTAIISAPLKTVSGKGLQGAAYVFTRSAGVWSQQAELTASDGSANDQFGDSVSLSGDTAVVGTRIRRAAYVFARSAGVWSQQGKLTTGTANFGYSVSVSGDTVLVGSLTDSGAAAYVFTRSAGAWSQQTKLTSGTVSDRFGASVSVGGDTAVVGAPQPPFGLGGHGNGAAYVFTRSGGVWSQLAALTASDGAADDEFGYSVSVSGDTAVIGATYHNTGGHADQGSAYAFTGPTLGTNSLLLGSTAGASSVALSIGNTTSWTASENRSWLHITSSSGTGSADVGFTYDAFTSTGTRSGTVTVAGLPVTVTQVGTDYAGPGGRLTLVSTGLKSPRELKVDGSGNLYIADSGNNAVKEWNASSQTVSKLVSSGLSAPKGVAVDGSGNVYIADTGNDAVKVWSASSQTVSTLVSSGLNDPSGVAVDSAGNVYISDSSHDALKEYNAATQTVNTLLTSGINTPVGLAVDVARNIYIANVTSPRLTEWNAATQSATALISSDLGQLQGAAVDGSGNVYFADSGNGRIKEWNAATQSVSAVVTNINGPGGVAVDAFGNLYFSSMNNNVIHEIPNAYVAPASVTESSSSGSGSLSVVPSTATLTGIYTPTSDSTSWLTIGTVSGGVVNFNFTANATGAPRTGHITVLGISIPVTQQASQTIRFGPLATKVLGAAPFTVTATASSGLTVSFDSLTPSVCTVSGSTVTMVVAGACTIVATQAGDSSYQPATPVDQTFTVTPGAQSTLTVTGPVSITYGSTGTASSSGGSGTGAVTFSAGISTGCSVSGTIVSVTNASGTCMLTATKGSDANYLSATSGQFAVTLVQATQATLAVTGPASIPYGGTGTATASGGSGAGTLSFSAGLSTGCSVSGTTVNVTNANGTCVLTATKASDGNYALAISAQFPVTLGQAPPSTLTVTGPSSITYGSTGTATAGGGSGTGAVTFSAGSSTGCAVSGTTVSVTNASGTCVLTATKAADGSNPLATSAPFTVTLVQATQAILTVIGPPGVTYGSTGTATAGGGSGTGAVTFSAGSSTGCAVSGTTVSVTNPGGTCVLTATKASDGNYALAISAQFPVSLVKGTQSTLTVTGPSSIAYGSTGTATASGGSGTGALAFSAGSSTGCSVIGTTVSVTNPGGTCVLTASKASDGYYAAATSAPFTVTLTSTPQAITLQTSPSGRTVSVDGGTARTAPFTVTLSAGPHTIAVAPTQPGATGTQYVFTGWNDAGAVSHSITVASSPATYTASFKTQYLLTTSASPPAGGTVTPASSFYDAGSQVPVQATANTGYTFANFSTGLTGSTNPQSITMNGPALVVANFTPLAPALAASVGARADGVPAGTRLVTINLTNTGLGPASNATITGITAIALTLGSGSVSVASGTPVNLGPIAPAGSGSATVTFNWPITAARVKFIVNFTADGGYSGSSTINTFR